MKVRSARRTVQLLAFLLLLLPFVWPANRLWFGTYLSSQAAGIALTDPLSAIEVILAGRLIWWPLIGSVIPLVITALLLGRVFCSWICPLNTVLEWAAVIKAPKVRGTRNGWLPFGILALFLLAAVLTSLPLFTILSPIGILSRAIAVGAGLEFLFIVALVALEWLYDRKAWCRNLCPVGALYGLLGKWRPVSIGIDHSRCLRCQQCSNACSMRVAVGSGKLLDQLTCTNCGDCVDACAAKAVSFTWKNKQKGGAVQRESMEGITR
ncbi:4Fe-4S binding protein [Sporomusa acidovorans]|uniref:Ferredoxin-type protein NapH n=1 Tax=Sporomusa acidovorans (strain ATCC 49682 / DSM 3132 / Mol) TaxID=1123286 RepID=A0ABZ3JAU2_SPOA4|nr:4Fe-4S binding protein [Sporomusa acidovorans]OZC21765.1 putative electron transport protein YccM [Sporomusa acidovorans DSM 3132]SDD57554.1 ferredoxin-type protein NapH [Sporomusa acidovorans]